ncbi:MAG TPA: hypothetical protein VK186_05085, partial [Candidatus Deferrimicrobium sp.]|nr:hypothetical protein [Candidatus Deferrimicrobium sp.]
WSGYTFFSINGKSNELKKPTKWRQLNFSFGCGYHRNMSLQFGLRAGIRAAYILYSEKAFGDKVSANALGIGLDVAGIYKVSRRLFSEISFCYIYASDTVEKIPIQLGGFKTEVGLGLRF